MLSLPGAGLTALHAVSSSPRLREAVIGTRAHLSADEAQRSCYPSPGPPADGGRYQDSTWRREPGAPSCVIASCRRWLAFL